MARQDREWSHPSEVGLTTRVQTDRRRGHMMVLLLAGFGAAALIGAAALASSRNDDAAGTGPSDPGDERDRTIVMVETEHHTDMDPLTGVVVDDATHVVVTALADDDNDNVSVFVGGERSSATVVATDEVNGLTLLRTDAAAAVEAVPAPGVVDGGSAQLLHFGADDRLHSHHMTVKDADARLTRPGAHAVEGMLVLVGPSGVPGPLADPSGRLMGWVLGSDGGRPMAYGADAFMAIVAQLAQHGDPDTGG